ncbi:MAG TPA: 6-phosphogluconolactonase [Oscillatoriaceae cyanobacterium M33_DOE_052]|uniref:6-phosphogluconolactonase n=1 Tax=Planktothricoides sp. SpSt-374 TaxID=2282167 RepID=A0A7C3ZPI8_9CYAN|nr:6-phosphogluconolactonase [Oscillatoriaceae cyanobacterium M33_DOE_052]
MGKQVEVLPDKAGVLARGLELVMEKIARSIKESGRCTIALAGGSTPKNLYEAIAAQSLPWDKIHVFWGDERYVSPEHPDSNQRMTRLAWLDRVPIPGENIHPMPTGSGEPGVDAQKHEIELRQFFGLADGEVPSFDIILLGMGDDGHTASLFPHTSALSVSDRLITVGSKDNQPRLTFTVPLINGAKCVIFLVTGAGKRPAAAQVFAPEGDPQTYPSRLIQPIGELWWLLDQEANPA